MQHTINIVYNITIKVNNCFEVEKKTEEEATGLPL